MIKKAPVVPVAKDDWLDISTVPKDGTPFIAYDGRQQICQIIPCYERKISPQKPKWWWRFVGKVEQPDAPPRKPELCWYVLCLSPYGYGILNVRPDCNWKPTHWRPMLLPPVPSIPKFQPAAEGCG